MFSRLLRFIGVTESTASFAEYLAKVLVWLGVLGGGSVVGLSVYASDLYAKYGYAAVSAAVLLGSLCLALTGWMAASAYRKFREARMFIEYDKRGSYGFNPRQAIFENQLLSVQDMFIPMNSVLEHKHFIGCDLIGPAIIMFKTTAYLDGCEFAECGDLLIVPRGTMVSSALVFQHCTFRNCRFYRTGIVTNDENIIRAMIASGARDTRILANPQSAPSDTPQPLDTGSGTQR